MVARYVYAGDRLTDPRLIGQACDPVLRPDGKCVVGRKPRNQLVVFEDGTQVVVLGRRLRLTSKGATVAAERPSAGTHEKRPPARER